MWHAFEGSRFSIFHCFLVFVHCQCPLVFLVGVQGLSYWKDSGASLKTSESESLGFLSSCYLSGQGLSGGLPRLYIIWRRLRLFVLHSVWNLCLKYVPVSAPSQTDLPVPLSYWRPTCVTGAFPQQLILFSAWGHSILSQKPPLLL